MADFAHSTVAPEFLPVRADLHHIPTTCPADLTLTQWRAAMHECIEAHLAAVDALVAVLDAQTPDADLEDDGTGEPILGWPDGTPGLGALDCASGGDDDREEENEHGGDVQDEPHDEKEQADDEPNLGRSETIDQSVACYTGTDPEFDRRGLAWWQDGNVLGNRMLRERGLPTLRGVPGLWW